MAEKRWTILIIPPGTGGTRTLHVGERTRRLIVAGLVSVALLVVAAVGTLFTPYATPSARLLASENERLRAELQGIEVVAVGAAHGVEHGLADHRRLERGQELAHRVGELHPAVFDEGHQRRADERLGHRLYFTD